MRWRVPPDLLLAVYGPGHSGIVWVLYDLLHVFQKVGMKISPPAAVASRHYCPGTTRLDLHESCSKTSLCLSESDPTSAYLTVVAINLPELDKHIR